MLEQQVHVNEHTLRGKILKIIQTPKVCSIYLETTRSRDGKATNNVRVVVFPSDFDKIAGFKKGHYMEAKGYIAQNSKGDSRMEQSFILTEATRAKSKLEELGYTKGSHMVERKNEGLYGGIVTGISVSKKNGITYLFMSTISGSHPTQYCVKFYHIPFNRRFLSEVKEGDNIVVSATIQTRTKSITGDDGIERTRDYENLVGMEAVRISQKGGNANE